MPRGVKGSAVCGTNGGYHQHRRNGQDACRQCKDAHSAYLKALKAARKNKPVAVPKPTATIAIHCPACGSSVESVNRRSMGAEVVAMVRCDNQRCSREFLVRAYVFPAARDADGGHSRCGTEAGYTAHKRAGEDTCDPCRMAHVDKAAGRDKRKKAAA